MKDGLSFINKNHLEYLSDAQPSDIINPETGEPYDECPICYEPVNPTDRRKSVITACKHVFHKKCINQVHTGKCPICRGPINVPYIGEKYKTKRHKRNKRKTKKHKSKPKNSKRRL